MLKFVLVIATLVTGGVVATKLSAVSPGFHSFLSANDSVAHVTVKSQSSGNITDTLLNGAATPTNPKAEKLINKVAVDKTRVVYLTGQVDFFMVKEITDKLKELEAASDKPIWLLIDSPGGSVLDGMTLISQIEASRAPVNTVCTRICASMAAMIHSYGSKRYALDRAVLMYHPASGGSEGQIKNMLSLNLSVQRMVDKMNLNVITRSGFDRAEFEKLIAYALWIDAEDSLAKGLLDGIVNLNVSHSNAESINMGGDRGKTIVVPKTSILDFQMIAPGF